MSIFLFSPDHSQTVVLDLLNVLVCCIEESDTVPDKVLEIILDSLVSVRLKKTSSNSLSLSPFKTHILGLFQEEKNAKLLAQHVLTRGEDKIKGPLTQLMEKLILGVKSTETDLHSKLHSIILEIHSCAPSLLVNILPFLESELRVEEEEVRRGIVHLLGRVFSSTPGAHTTYPTLFASFCSRFVDRDLNVRLVMIEFAEHYIPRQTDTKVIKQVLGSIELKNF